MKKLFNFLFIILALVLLWNGAKKVYHIVQEKNRITEAKKGWHVEVLSDTLNVREDHDRNSNKIGEIKKGEIYEVVDYYVESGKRYWYEIIMQRGKHAWVANTIDGEYLKDYKGFVDVATPTLKFEEDEYHVLDIDSIKTDHLIIWDDRDDYKITYEVYHEVDKQLNKNQYWIKWTVTDASGKKASKVQLIVFEVKPSEDQVKPFSEFNRK